MTAKFWNRVEDKLRDRVKEKFNAIVSAVGSFNKTVLDRIHDENWLGKDDWER